MKRQIEGAGQIVFGGVYHFLDQDGLPICNAQRVDDRLYDDTWIGDVGLEGVPTPVHIVNEKVTCKRCKSMAPIIEPDNPPLNGEEK